MLDIYSSLLLNHAKTIKPNCFNYEMKQLENKYKYFLQIENYHYRFLTFILHWKFKIIVTYTSNNARLTASALKIYSH